MFKQNFIKFCSKKGESPSFVCKQVGIAPATFSCWTETSVPRNATLLRISEYLGVTVEDLLRDPDEQLTAEPTLTTEPAPTSPLSDRFNNKLDQLTLQELRELEAFMDSLIKNRK